MKENTSFYLGIDVSKPYFGASIIMVVSHQKQPRLTERFANTTAGLKVFHRWLVSLKVTFDANSLLVIENTGLYHRLLWKYCSEYGLPI
jgi:transposase